MKLYGDQASEWTLYVVPQTPCPNILILHVEAWALFIQGYSILDHTIQCNMNRIAEHSFSDSLSIHFLMLLLFLASSINSRLFVRKSSSTRAAYMVHCSDNCFKAAAWVCEWDWDESPECIGAFDAERGREMVRGKGRFLNVDWYPWTIDL